MKLAGCPGLASARSLLDAIPNLRDSRLSRVLRRSGLHRGSTSVAARWLMSAPGGTAGVVLIPAGFVRIRNRRTHDASRCASALTVVGIVSAMFLWFWGPCRSRPAGTSRGCNDAELGRTNPVVVGLVVPGGPRASRSLWRTGSWDSLGACRPPPPVRAGAATAVVDWRERGSGRS